MRGLDRPLATALALGALLCACAPPAPSPTPSPTTTPPPPEEEYPATHVTLLVYPIQRGCAVVAIPYYAFVKEDGEIVWDIVDDACRSRGKVDITFAEAGIVDIESDEAQAGEAAAATRRQKKGKVRGAADKKPHKYTVTVGTFVHDPEIEIWP